MTKKQKNRKVGWLKPPFTYTFSGLCQVSILNMGLKGFRSRECFLNWRKQGKKALLWNEVFNVMLKKSFDMMSRRKIRFYIKLKRSENLLQIMNCFMFYINKNVNIFL